MTPATGIIITNGKSELSTVWNYDESMALGIAAGRA